MANTTAMKDRNEVDGRERYKESAGMRGCGSCCSLRKRANREGEERRQKLHTHTRNEKEKRAVLTDVYVLVFVCWFLRVTS